MAEIDLGKAAVEPAEAATSRMTLCNMSVELGARLGSVSTDDTTVEYVRARSRPP